MAKKLRQDSWATRLTEEQSWKLYYRSRGAQWQDAVKWAAEEFALEETPGRSAFYRWLAWMREQEHAHRMEQAAIAAAEAAALGKTCTKDESLISAFKALATETALASGNSKDAVSFINAAMAIKDRLLHDAELEIKAKAQAVKEDELKLAVKRFEAAEAKLKAVNEAVTAAKDGGITPETLRKIEEAAGLL